MFNITVTEADYLAGCPDDPLACPLCKAIMRMMPTAHQVCVTRTELYINDMIFPVKPDMLAFIDVIDNGRAVTLPQTFRVGR